MEKLIITIAPTGNVPTKQLTPHVPLTAEEIAADIVECYQKGAAVAHIHARDNSGSPTCDRHFFAEILQALQAKSCPIVRQLSTGARGGTGEERASVLELYPHSASLATGSSNFPQSINANDPALIEHMAGVMLQHNIKPEIEVFDAAMIQNALYLRKKGLLTDPLVFNLVLGVKGSLAATAKNLFFLIENLPANAVWSVSIIGKEHVNLSAIAIALGGNVRVGIEDNIYYTKGVLARNTELVERIAAIAKSMGRELATPDDVQRIWNIM
jgi:3-keto-5-aminohexanoate cleavage enzyme